MLSNKLTFSLTSLVFLLMFAFVATSVIAATGGPTVTITDAGTATAASTRDAFMLKFTFSEGVTGFDPINVIGDVDYVYLNEFGTPLATPAAAALARATGTTDIASANGRSYTVSVELESIPTTGAVAFQVRVKEDAADGASGGNVAKSQRFDLPLQERLLPHQRVMLLC